MAVIARYALTVRRYRGRALHEAILLSLPAIVILAGASIIGLTI